MEANFHPTHHYITNTADLIGNYLSREFKAIRQKEKLKKMLPEQEYNRQ